MEIIALTVNADLHTMNLVYSSCLLLSTNQHPRHNDRVIPEYCGKDKDACKHFIWIKHQISLRLILQLTISVFKLGGFW